MKKSPKKLLQFDALLQAICHKFCWFTTFGSLIIGVLNSRSSGHLERLSSAELSFLGMAYISMQEDSCAGVLEVFHWEGETCISSVLRFRPLNLSHCAQM